MLEWDRTWYAWYIRRIVVEEVEMTEMCMWHEAAEQKIPLIASIFALANTNRDPHEAIESMNGICGDKMTKATLMKFLAVSQH